MLQLATNVTSRYPLGKILLIADRAHKNGVKVTSKNGLTNALNGM